MKMKCVTLLTSCFLFAFAAGCASTGEFESLRGTVTGLQVESSRQEKELTQVKTSLPEIAADLSTLKDQGFTAIRESQASLLTQTSDLSKEVQMLKGRFDENKYASEKVIKDLISERDLQQVKMAALENEVKDLKTKINALVAEVKEARTAPEKTEKKDAANPSDSAKQPEARAAEAADPANPQKLYDDAQVDFKEKRHPEARQKMERFAADFPNHALAPNAMFWTGETFYSEKKYEEAILAYEGFLKKYPSHDKAKGAMLKQAYAFVEMGDRKTGKVILERLIERFPQSAEAELAEKKIAEVLSKNGAGPGGSASTKSKKKKR